LAIVIAPESPILFMSELQRCIPMPKIVRFLRPLDIAVVPKYPILLFSELHKLLLTTKVVRFLRLLEIAIAPESPMLLFSKLLYCLLIPKPMRFFRLCATNCAPLSLTPKSINEWVPFPSMLKSFICGSCMLSTISFGIVLSARSTALKPPMVKVL
jgi:hypothetical protein